MVVCLLLLPKPFEAIAFFPAILILSSSDILSWWLSQKHAKPCDQWPRESDPPSFLYWQSAWCSLPFLFGPLKVQPAPAYWQATSVPSHLYLRWSSNTPRWEISLHESELGQITNSLSSNLNVKTVSKIEKISEHLDLNLSDAYLFRTRLDGVHVISLRGFRQIGQEAFTRR